MSSADPVERLRAAYEAFTAATTTPRCGWRPCTLSPATSKSSLVYSRTRARGAGSGIEMEVEGWTVWTLDEDGLVTRAQTVLRHEEAEARASAGLPPRGR